MLSCWKGCAQAAQATNPLRPKSVKAARSSHCASCTLTPRPAATLALGNAVRIASLGTKPYASLRSLHRSVHAHKTGGSGLSSPAHGEISFATSQKFLNFAGISKLFPVR